jgi:putative methanogenesis marker protein 6
MIKETCFGLQITGMPEEVERVLGRLRSFDPEHVFVKDRGFPPGDERRCRANLGGARPGYFGHEYEVNFVLRSVSHGLSALKSRVPGTEADPPSPAKKTYLDTTSLKKIIEKMEP